VRPGVRLIALTLCSTVLLAGLGCATGREQAESESKFLYPGMSMQEVSDRLGEPHQVIQGGPGTETCWIYRYEGGPSAAATVVMVLVFVAIVALAVASKSGGGSFGGGGGGSDGPPCQIRLRFDPDGRLIDVSPPHPVPGS
jgi:hypothetical protein